MFLFNLGRWRDGARSRWRRVFWRHVCPCEGKHLAWVGTRSVPQWLGDTCNCRENHISYHHYASIKAQRSISCTIPLGGLSMWCPPLPSGRNIVSGPKEYMLANELHASIDEQDAYEQNDDNEEVCFWKKYSAAKDFLIDRRGRSARCRSKDFLVLSKFLSRTVSTYIGASTYSNGRSPRADTSCKDWSDNRPLSNESQWNSRD